jgi:hypothetical protein
MQPTQKNKGYILLMSVLVASIILAISLGVYALSIKDLILAGYLKDSAIAFGAADKGIECALYWDRSAPQDGLPYTIFTTSTQYVSLDYLLLPPPVCDTSRLDTLASWRSVNAPDPTTGTTNFTLTFPDNTCAEIEVFKESSATTTIISNGYNTCDVTSPRRTQRTIQVQGNF